MTTCTRCGNERKTMPRYVMHAHGFSSLAAPDFTVTPPQTERICGDCLTGDEILRELSPVADYLLSVLIENGKKDDPPHPEIMKSLDIVRAFFQTRLNNGAGRNRAAAVRALGLTDDR